LLSACLLFAPSLTVLGMVGPVAVRLAPQKGGQLGRRVGGIYAVSTFGSLAGTLFVAFIAIPAFDERAILSGAGGLLVLLGGASLAFRGRTGALALTLL